MIISRLHSVLQTLMKRGTIYQESIMDMNMGLLIIVLGHTLRDMLRLTFLERLLVLCYMLRGLEVVLNIGLMMFQQLKWNE